VIALAQAGNFLTHAPIAPDVKLLLGAHKAIGGRQNQEDRFEVIPGVLGVVCDGMGGHAGGEVASRIAGAAIRAHVRACVRPGQTSTARRDILGGALRAAHIAVGEQARRQPSLRGMGTTAAALMVGPGCVIVAHTGDSRIYRLRAGAVSQLTADHAGWYNDAHGGRVWCLDHAIGTHGFYCDIAIHEALPGDQFVLCSDGLYEKVDAPDMIAALALRPSAAARALVRCAMARNTCDNCTAVTCKVVGGSL
jgi:serine/threonine protein phosphatase PrpC